MTNEKLTSELAGKVMGWNVCPDRFLTGNRSWIPRWRFQPLDRLEDAFRLLEAAGSKNYTMGSDDEGFFLVRVQVDGTTGEARNESKSRAITEAVAHAIGIEFGTHQDSGTPLAVRRPGHATAVRDGI
jgi:hypothetical protein